MISFKKQSLFIRCINRLYPSGICIYHIRTMKAKVKCIPVHFRTCPCRAPEDWGSQIFQKASTRN